MLYYEEYWEKSTVQANYDNEAVVTIINSDCSQEPLFMHLLCSYFLLISKIRTVDLVPGRQNTLADAISKDNAAPFLYLSPQADQMLTEVPQDLIDKLLIEKSDWTSNSWTLWFHTTFNFHTF